MTHISSFWVLILAAGGPYWVLFFTKKWVLIGSLSQTLGVFISFRDSANGEFFFTHPAPQRKIAIFFLIIIESSKERLNSVFGPEIPSFWWKFSLVELGGTPPP